MKNNLTVKELICKKETLELELLTLCQNKIAIFKRETERSIKDISMLFLNVSNINREEKMAQCGKWHQREEYFLTNITISISI